MTKRNIVLSALDKVNKFREIDTKFLVRVDGFRIVGIVTKIKRVYDSQIGKDRRWAMGVTMDGDIFEEPLDRKNPKSGRLEDVVQRETEFLIITARKTFDASDRDENFSWLPHQFSMDRMKHLEDEVEALQRINNNMDEKMKQDRRHMEIIEQDARNTAEANKNLRETVYYMSKKMNELEMENHGMYVLLQRLRAYVLEGEGELSVDLQRALEKGKQRAISAHELRMKKLREDEEERQQLRASFPLADIENVKGIIEETIEKTKQQSAQAKQKTKPPLIKEESIDDEEEGGGEA